MNNLTSLFPTNYKNLEQPAAIALLEKIEKAVEDLDNKKKIQKVVRTFPNGYATATKYLQEALSQGYIVVMCNVTKEEKGGNILEYIVEKEVERERNG